MSSPSTELQVAILNALKAATGVHAICGDRIYDGRPDDAAFPCVTFGPTQYIPEDVECIVGGIEVVQLDCWARDGGKLWPAKDLAAAVKAALHEASLSLSTHALARISVTSVRTFLDPDGKTAHGVVIVEAEIEEV